MHSLREVLFIRVNIATTYYAVETSRAETSRRPRETCFGRRWVTTSSEFCNRFVWRFLPRVSIPGVQSFRPSQRVKFNVSRFNVRCQFYTEVTKKHQNMMVEWKKRSDRIKYLYDGTSGRMEIRNYFSCAWVLHFIFKNLYIPYAAYRNKTWLRPLVRLFAIQNNRTSFQTFNVSWNMA